MYYLKFILLLPCIFSKSSCEVTEEKKAKLLSDFINYYNFRPNVGHRASDGFLRSVNEIDQSTYQIEVSFIATQQHSDKSKMMKCTAGVQDLDDKGIAIVNNVIDCDELKPPPDDPNQAFFTADVPTGKPLINLENEVQSEASITSGEQFIAIPRIQPSAPCIGCASLVNPQAQGVQDLASMGVRHLDIHEPNVKHSLDSVIEVERQVQVINGVRYILTLSILFDHCTELKTESCITTKTCRISILVKPWRTLPNGAKYRAILSNNCTEQWLFGDDGEVLPEPTVNQDSNKKDEHTSSDDEIQVKRHEDVQSQPNAEKRLTPDQIKALEEQILPLDPVRDSSNHKADTLPSENKEANKDHVIKVITAQQYSENVLPPSESSKHEPITISEDKKKAIDEMLDFLKFSGYRPQNRPQPEDSVSRQKRSYDYDLQLLSLTEDFRDLKQSIENAKYIYEMAQTTVDYLNEMDIEVKNRAVKNVIKAEEEEDNEKRFMYIQVQVVIPCDTASCDPKEIQTKICNGVVDSTDKKSPQVLYTFCYADSKEAETMDKAKEIALNDPVLLRLSKEVLRKLEFDSTDSHAMKIQKIVSANTRVASGRLTKITMIVDYIDCSKSVSSVLRKKCSVLQYLGSKVCEVLVHERQWLKEKKITYTCTERPMDIVITKNKQNKNITVDDPKISEILQDTLQYLETQSSKKNKQQIISVNKISTQVLAGFLIKIEFIVGYTNCSNNGSTSQSSKCFLLKNERLRSCRAQVWDRSWIVDGRQMEVVCDEIDDHRSKRQAIGYIMEQNPDDRTYRQLAEESLQKYVSNSSDKKPHTLLRIEKVTTQVVAGSLTNIDFVTEIDFAAVPNDNPQGDVKKCHSKIWEHRWLNEKEVTVTCDIVSHKSKRGIPGGVEEQNPDDPKYRELALESLQKYVSDSGDMKLHTLLRIEKVTTQVVAGSLTEIDFVAVPNDNPQGDVKKCHSKIWERRWLNEKEVTVTCDIVSHKSKRGIRGGVKEQNPDDPKYRELALESLQKYVSDSGDMKLHTLLRIEKVTTQVVAGSLTEIDFVAVPNDNPQGDVKKCHSKIWERPWLNEKEVTVTCDIVSHKSKRGIPGGVEEQNPDDPKYRELALESLQKYVSDSGDMKLHTLLRIEKVTTQVVAGSLTEIDFVAVPNDNPQGDVKKCHSKIWERRWLNEKEVTVTCDIVSHKSKRGIRGGVKEQNPDDPKYRELALESLQKYVSDSGDMKLHTLLRIEKVTTQVVAGSLTKIDFVAVPNDNPQGDVKKCHSKIWERPWLNEKEVTVTCDIVSHKSKRGIPGGVEEQNPDDPKYRELALESLQKYVSDSGDMKLHTLLRIEKVTTQVVAGSLTEIDFVAVPNDNPQGDVKKCHSKIWERRWLNEKEVTVTCDIVSHKSKRAIPGGVKEQNPDDPEYRQLALESIQKYVLDSGDMKPHTLLRIEKVTTKVVEGSLTEIDFVAVPNDNPQGDVKKCHSKIWERRWLNEKEVTVTCDIVSHKSKRAIPGGVKEQNPDDPEYRQLALESIQKYVLDSGDMKPHTLLRIEKVTTQVVAGSLTEIDFVAVPNDNPQGDVKKCHSKIWERPWLNEKEVTVTCDIVSHKSKRGIPGGVEEQNPDDPKYRELALESLQKYVSDSGDMKLHTLLRIEKVTTQVVAGSLTEIDFVAVPNDNPQGDVKKCHSKIWERRWLNEKEVTVTCDIVSHKSKRGIRGGVKEQNPDDPKYRELALESLQKYVSDSGDMKLHTLLRIEKVTTQVVAGSLTKIDFVAVPNDNPQGDVKKCHSKIWERPWLNEKEVTVTCDIVSHKSKRRIPGGVEEQNPDDPKYRELALESLQKYVSDSGDMKLHTLLRIEKVTTQVVAGSLTEIDFVAVPNDNPQGDVKKCHSKIWERRWLNEKEVTVTCDIVSHKSKRAIPGGVKEQNPDDPEYRQLALESIQKYVLDSGDMKPHTLLRIEKVTTKVVEGSLTEIDFVAVPNDNPQGDVKKCHSKIWERRWLNEKEVTVTCDIVSHKSKRAIPGGVKEQNPDDPEYRQLALESIQKYVLDSGDMKPHTLLRIEKVTTKVVEGSLTEIDFVAVPNDNPQGDVKKCHSKIWERRWLNEKEVTVTCDIVSHKSKRAIPGGVKEQNPDDPEYRQLALESIQKYVLDSGDMKPHTLLRIEKVTTKVVEGSLTEIDFVAVPNDNPQGDVKKCHSKIWERRWLNEKEVTVTCDIVSHKSKRAIPGGVKEQNPDDPEYRQLALESIQKYVLDSGDMKPHTLLRIEKVTTKVVEGSLTEIDFVAVPNDNPQGDVKKCHSKIWERRWLNEKEVTVTCDIVSHKSKRAIPGGVKEQNPDDPEYRQLALESIQKYVLDSGDMKPHTLLRIEKVTTKVVEGSLTEIDFVAVPNDNPQGDVKKCHSKIWERRWLNEKEVTVTCDIVSHKSKRAIPGGVKEQNPDDPEYRQLALESIQKYVLDSGDMKPHTLLRIEKVTTKVVEGSLTEIDFVAVPNDNPQGDVKKCHSKIWERRWLNEKEVTVTCDIVSHKSKRAIPGGVKEQNPDDPEYRQLALESIQKYVLDSGDMKPHTLLRIEKVTTKVVEGSLTEIDFVAVPNDNPQGDVKKCHSKIWERRWLNEKEVTVTCDIVSHKSKRAIPGGVKEQNPDDPEYRQLALESIQKYVLDSGDMKPHTLLRIEKVTTKVVEGSLTEIDFVAVPNDNPQGDVKKCHSKIWERRWLNEKEVTVTCDIVSHKSKRAIPGGVKEQNPDDPEYRQLALESIQKYVLDSGDMKPHTLLRIEKVTTKVVEGSLTEIDFVAVPNDNPQGDVKKCHSKIWERRWLNEKEVTVTCDIVSHKSKRAIPGGVKEQNPDDPEYRQLALESIQKYVLDSGDMKPHTLLRIEKVTTKVVEGSLTEIDFVAVPNDNPQGDVKKCHSKIWERRWLNEKEVTVTCDIVSHKSKRAIPGGVKEQNPDDPEYRQLALESIQKYVLDSGDMKPHTLLRIEKVTTKVVEGSLTEIDFVAVPNDNPQGDVKKCHSKIWERRWLNEKEVTVTCDIVSHKSKRAIPGGVKEQNPDDPEYRQLALESIQKYVLDSGDMKPHTLLRIEKVTTKVVEGSLTEIDFVAVPNDNPQGDVKKCHSKIWERRWLNEKEVTVTCDIVSHKSKRAIPGGVKEQNPDDPEYRQLALESLQKYVSDSGDMKPHTLLRIEKVTTQVVAGSLTKIDFVAVPIDNSQDVIQKCHSEIWERPWLKEKRITVFCEIDDYRTKRELVGGEMEQNENHSSKQNITSGSLIEQNPSEPQYLQLANESLKKFLIDNCNKKLHNLDQESMQKFLINICNKEPHKVAKVVKVTTQMVSGKLTRLEFIILPTNTSKSDIIECHAEVWERPLTEEKDIKISCELLFINIENPKNASYIQWADESLLKYLSDTNNHYPYKVVQIEQATLQGFLTKIIFVASLTDKLNDSLTCVSEIFNAPWLTVKTISVICESDTSIDREQWNFMNGSNKNKHIYYTHKKIEEEQDVAKPEFHLLALQSLRKFSKSTGTLHKLLAINQVTKISASRNIAYQIKFIANPTECLFNVSNMRALTCQLISNTTFHCKAKIWYQSEPEKKMYVKCVLPEDYLDLLESDEEDKISDTDNELTETEFTKKTQESKARELAEEALEQYLSYTYAKYVHKIIAIHSYYEYLANDIIEFAISPTECLITNFKDPIDDCPFVQPRVIHNCKAIAKLHVLFRSDNDMKVKCIKVHMSNKKTNNRKKRQINAEHMDDVENEIDEDTMYYYAKSAISQINSSPRNSNMFKLVTIHAVKSTIQMKAIVVKMYLEVAESYCVRYQTDVNIDNCEEMEGLNHRLCLARIYPAPSDELVIRHVHVVCDDDEREFNALTGLHPFELLRLSIEEIERKPETHFKLVHQGEPQLIPSLEAKNPLKLNFIIAFTNCSKTVDLDKNPYQCFLDSSMPSKSCSSYIWLETATRTIKYINVDCNSDNSRQKRSSLNAANLTTDTTDIKDLVDAALAKLEMSSLHRYKQRVLHINSYSSKITTGKVTTIDFDVAYTSCIKYEWVKNVTDCDIIDHLPRRHCVAQIWERLWIHNGQNINVTCEDDETPLEAHIEFESAEMASQLAQQALKHIEAKYPHPQKQKIVRIFSLEKQLVAGIHYKMKVEVGFTHCLALSVQTNCTLDNELYMNRFCRVNVWLRPWTDHPPNFRVSCDFQESVTSDLYHSIQAEHLFYEFITTYNPSYVNDHAEFARRFEIFKANIKKIHELNVHEKGTATYGVTRFTDLTYKEFSSRYAGLNRNLRNNSQMAMKEADVPKINLPANFDWREFDAVTEVKDQGSCGSSWAFSVTGNIEGQWRMQSGELVSLSEQQLLDCDGVNKGCGGGLPENAYRIIEDQGGLETELNYPYEGEVDKCLFNKTLAKAKISGAVNITSNETGMALWLVQNGPISIGINANAMQFYVNGISHPWNSYCDPDKLDHAALIVGYGYKEYQAFNKKITYWIVKNSWGTAWGEQGYYRVHRGTGTCGVNKMATSAFIPSM